MNSTDFMVTVYHENVLSDSDIKSIIDGIDSSLESDRKAGLIEGYVIVEDN